jgi:hypothetical protein
MGMPLTRISPPLRRIDSGEHIQKRGFATPRRPTMATKITFLNVDVDAAQDIERPGGVLNVLTKLRT